jgi:hypothetical protein
MLPETGLEYTTCRERVAVKLGCCSRCIALHRRAVVAGETAWAELERRGLVLLARTRGGGVAERGVGGDFPGADIIDLSGGCTGEAACWARLRAEMRCTHRRIAPSAASAIRPAAPKISRQVLVTQRFA